MRLGLGLGVDSITSQKTGAGFTGILDEYSGAVAAYSVRRLSSTYTDGLIRVRRSSDDTEQDIGFDSNGDLDTSALTTFVNEDVNTYSSDFTSGNEDLGESQGTGADGQSIAGVDDAYKFTLNSANDAHYARVLGAFDLKNTYTVKLEYYIPSGQTVDTIDVRTGLITDGVYSQSVTDAWTSVTITDWSPTDSSPLRFYACDGATKIFAADGDVFYLKNISITQTTADGAVTTFYDQSGNGNNATNSTASEQPLVVSGGTLVEENGKAAIEYDGAGDQLALSSAISLGDSDFAVNLVYRSLETSSEDYILFGQSGQSRMRLYDYQVRLYISNVTYDFSSSNNFGSQYLYTLEADASRGLQVYRDGTATGSELTIASGDNFVQEFIGNGVTRPIKGRLQEVIIFNSDQSTNRTGIETNINDHFDIYTP